jgi:beta-mannosidase
LVRATQMLQAEGVRYAIESNRRRVPRNSGSLPWQFNEPYPMAACTSAVDYHGRPKALYHAVAAAFAPLALSARYATLAWGGHERFEAELWACSALRSPLNEATLAAQLVGASGVVYAQHVASVAVAANSPTRLGAIACPLARIDEEVFLLDITMSDPTGALVAATRVCFSATANLAPLLSLPHTELAVTLADTGEGWAVTVRNTGLVAALFVRVADARDPRAPGFARFASNHHCLLPGEQQTVHVVWDEVPPEARQLTISGWNIDAQRLSAPVRPSATV